MFILILDTDASIMDLKLDLARSIVGFDGDATLSGELQGIRLQTEKDQAWCIQVMPLRSAEDNTHSILFRGPLTLCTTC